MASLIRMVLAFIVFFCMHSRCIASNPLPNTVQIFPSSTLDGTEGGSVRIACERHYKSTNAEWTFPVNSAAVKDNRAIETDITMIQEGSIINYLEIVNLKHTDAGRYTCSLTNNRTVSDSVNVRIFGASEKPPVPRISFDETNVIFNGQNLSMTCYTDEIFTLHWTGPANSTAKSTNRMVESIAATDKQIQNTLHITNVSTSDQGMYTCVSTYRGNQQSNSITQLVDTIYASPGAFIHDAFVKPGESVQLQCTVVSTMSCDVAWYFQTCDWNKKSKFPGSSNCSNWVKIDTEIEHEFNEGSQYSIIEYHPQSAGQVKCQATNSDESYEAVANVYVQPIDSEQTLVITPSRIFIGNATRVSCMATKYLFSDSLELFRDGQLVAEDIDIQIHRIDTEYMHEIVLAFAKITSNHSGIYTCTAITYDNEKRNVQSDLIINASPYFITESHHPVGVAVSIVTPVILTCEAIAGFPAPNIQWLKNSHPIPASNPYVKTNSTHLFIARSIEEDSGRYECVADNQFGQISKVFNVNVTTPGVSTVIVVVMVLGAMVLVTLAVALFVMNRRKYSALRL